MAAPHEAVRMLLRSALTARDEHPSARLAIAEEVIGVLRATTPEKQEAFLDRGVDMVSEIMKPLSAQGVQVRVEPIVLAGLLRALAFIGLHSEDVGPKIAPKVQDLLIESLARALVPSARSR